MIQTWIFLLHILTFRGGQRYFLGSALSLECYLFFMSASARSQRFQICQCAKCYSAMAEASARRYPPQPGGGRGDRGAQAQLNLRSSQPKSLPQYLYSSKKMVLITHGHIWRNFPQPDTFLYCLFWVIRPWPAIWQLCLTPSLSLLYSA
jgi:hypothetical protein